LQRNKDRKLWIDTSNLMSVKNETNLSKSNHPNVLEHSSNVPEHLLNVLEHSSNVPVHFAGFYPLFYQLLI
jgi:hypothetical protein